MLLPWRVDQKSKELTAERSRGRIDRRTLEDKTVDALMKLDLPAGVDVEIKLQ